MQKQEIVLESVLLKAKIVKEDKDDFRLITQVDRYERIYPFVTLAAAYKKYKDILKEQYGAQR